MGVGGRAGSVRHWLLEWGQEGARARASGVRWPVTEPCPRRRAAPSLPCAPCTLPQPFTPLFPPPPSQNPGMDEVSQVKLLCSMARALANLHELGVSGCESGTGPESCPPPVEPPHCVPARPPP